MVKEKLWVGRVIMDDATGHEVDDVLRHSFLGLFLVLFLSLSVRDIHSNGAMVLLITFLNHSFFGVPIYGRQYYIQSPLFFESLAPTRILTQAT